MGHSRGTPVHPHHGQHWQNVKAGEAKVQVPPAPALPCDFEAEVPPASQSLTISDATDLPRAGPAPGTGDSKQV